MEKKKLIELPEKYGWFFDKENSDQPYALTPEAIFEKHQILEMFDRKEENVPDGYTVKALKIGLSEILDDREIYRITDEEAVDFPINRMEGTLLPVYNDKS